MARKEKSLRDLVGAAAYTTHHAIPSVFLPKGNPKKAPSSSQSAKKREAKESAPSKKQKPANRSTILAVVLALLALIYAAMHLDLFGSDVRTASDGTRFINAEGLTQEELDKKAKAIKRRR